MDLDTDTQQRSFSLSHCDTFRFCSELNDRLCFVRISWNMEEHSISIPTSDFQVLPTYRSLCRSHACRSLRCARDNRQAFWLEVQHMNWHTPNTIDSVHWKTSNRIRFVSPAAHVNFLLSWINEEKIKMWYLDWMHQGWHMYRSNEKYVFRCIKWELKNVWCRHIPLVRTQASVEREFIHSQLKNSIRFSLNSPPIL